MNYLHQDINEEVTLRNKEFFYLHLYPTCLIFYSISTIALITPFAGSSQLSNSSFTSSNFTRCVMYVEGFTNFLLMQSITCSKSCRVALRLLINVVSRL